MITRKISARNACDIVKILEGSVWHSTRVELYQEILESGAISRNPRISDVSRWAGRRDSGHRPFARIIGGVSLFDFRDNRIATAAVSYPLSNWQRFLVGGGREGPSVWMKVNTDRLNGRFLKPEDLLERWKLESLGGNPIMPGIEAVYLGDVSVLALDEVLLISIDGPT